MGGGKRISPLREFVVVPFLHEAAVQKNTLTGDVLTVCFGSDVTRTVVSSQVTHRANSLAGEATALHRWADPVTHLHRAVVVGCSFETNASNGPAPHNLDHQVGAPRPQGRDNGQHGALDERGDAYVTVGRKIGRPQPTESVAGAYRHRVAEGDGLKGDAGAVRLHATSLARVTIWEKPTRAGATTTFVPCRRRSR